MAVSLFDLTGRRALITGSTQGIGYSIALGLAEAGAHVILNGRGIEKLEAASASLAETGAKVDTLCFDVTRPV